MRIDLSLLRTETLFSNKSLEWLLTLLGGKKIVEGVVERVSTDTIVLRAAGQTVELPQFSVENLPVPLSLSRGQRVELSLVEGEKLRIRVIPPPTDARGPVFDVQERAEQVLIELNIPPSKEAVMAVESLIKLGWPLREELVLAVLPWAEQGQLEAVLPLVQGGFPLLPELAVLLEHPRPFGPEESFTLEQKLPELGQVLGNPHVSAFRQQLAEKLKGGKDTAPFTKVFLQERLLESLVNQRGNGTQFVFAWPVLIGEKVFPGWIRVWKKPDKEKRHANTPPTGRFHIELHLPTATLGVVYVEITVDHKRLTCQFAAENPTVKKRLEEGLNSLTKELTIQGWEQVESHVVVHSNKQLPTWAELMDMEDGSVSFIDVRG